MQRVKYRSRFKRAKHDQLVHLTDMDIPMLQALNRHGPLPSCYLGYFHNKGRNRQHTNLRLALHYNNTIPGRNGSVFERPTAQRNIETLGNYMVSDLAPVGVDELKRRELYEDAIRPTGWFNHQLMISCVTASIEIGAIKRGIEYIPGHRILAEKGKTLTATVNGKRFCPDQFFALKYPDGSYQAYVVEANRGTEQKRDTRKSKARKTFESEYLQYKRFVGRGQYKTDYGLKCGLRVLQVMSNPASIISYMANMEDCPYIGFRYLEGFGDVLKPPPILDLSTWSCKGHKDFDIYDY